MASPPVPYTWQHKEIPDFRQMEARTADVLDFLMNPPMVRLRKTNTQSIPNSTSTAISWDLVELEQENFWVSSAPTRITPPIAGWYVGFAGFSFAANSTGYREMDIRKNAHATLRSIRTKSDAYAGSTTVGRGTTFIESFNGTTDYIEMLIWQNSGGSLSTSNVDFEYTPDLSLKWLASL